MPRLTKQAILDGSNNQDTLTIKEYEGAKVMIKSLTDGELSKIFSIIGNVPLKSDGTPDFNKIDIDKNFDALRMAASMGMTDPKLTLEEVGKMKFGVPEYIGMKVLEFSGVTGADAKKKR
jgi:hypothetical protein